MHKKRVGTRSVLKPEEEFIDFIYSNSLLTLPNKGPLYTWNSLIKGKEVQKRLDRVLVNTKWLDHAPMLLLTHLEKVLSDRCPLFLQESQPTPLLLNHPPFFL